MSNSNDPTAMNYAAAPNAQRLLWAGFMAILAAGVGFSVRGGILGQWAEEFGFTMTELGTITGGGLTGFGIVIIVTSLFADAIGYGKLMSGAFVLHFISAVITLAAPAAFAAGGKDAAFMCLFVGMFIFAIGNGVCEAVVNPLTATLFPNNKTHYLNILHAGWPAGLVIGGLASAFMADKVNDAGEVIAAGTDWKIQMSLFLIPVIIYGIMLFRQAFPKSEVASAGITLGEVFKSIMVPVFIFLLLIHALVGYVELGTDSWISKITGKIMASPQNGLYLFVYTSSLMFVLRFFAGPIVHRISPLGLLLVSSVLGIIGLTMLGGATTIIMCIIAATIYACGKTFLWPTMLAVGSERFPKGGAVAIGLMGGAGMLSAGLLGGPGIGFKQDKYASENLQETSPEAFERYKADEENGFLFGTFKTNGLNGQKVGVLADSGKTLAQDLDLLNRRGDGNTNNNLTELNEWWQSAQSSAEADKEPVDNATLFGSRMALKLTAIVPAVMAICYLLLLGYFKATGGYKALTVNDKGEVVDAVETAH